MPVTANKGFSVQSAGTNPGTWGAGASTALNEGVIQILDANLGTVVSKTLSNVNIALSATEAQACCIRLIGTLTGNVVVTNSNIGFYFVENLTSGAFTVTVTNGVAGVVITQGYRVPVFADATNGVRTMLPPPVVATNPDLSNVTLAISAAYIVVNADITKTISASGAGYSISFNAPAGYSATFAVRVTNTSTTRAKAITISGLSTFFLYPWQSIVVFIANGVWQVTPQATGLRYRPSAGTATIYVDPVNGSDSNDGLAAGVGGAVATIQKAVDRFRNEWDFGLSGVGIVQLAAGQHNVLSGVNINGATIGQDLIQINGDSNNPSAYTIVTTNPNGSCLFVRDQGIVQVSGVKFQAFAGGCTAINCSQGAVVDVMGNCIFDLFSTGVHISVATWASVNILTNYTVSGDATVHIQCQSGGYVNYGSFNCNVSVPVAVSFWVTCSYCGVVNSGGVPMTFTGSASTGTKYSVAYNGVLTLSGATLPGSIAGTTATGGQVQP